MSYELKQFRIKIVIVEPGVIKTNFAFVTAKRALDANSSYSEINEQGARKFKFNDDILNISKRICNCDTKDNNRGKSNA